MEQLLDPSRQLSRINRLGDMRIVTGSAVSLGVCLRGLAHQRHRRNIAKMLHLAQPRQRFVTVHSGIPISEMVISNHIDAATRNASAGVRQRVP